MNVKKLDVGIQSVKKIIHIADLHIRLLKRHKEYRSVFSKLYDKINQIKTDDTIIYVAGDLVHNKLDLSPECIDLLQEFLRNLGDILPTIVIPGNHDLNLNNFSRQDAIQPVINALNHPNIHYLKESGIYQFGGIDWVVMAVHDKPINFINAEECPGKYKIALHHGAVHKAQTDVGYKITNDHVTVEKFKGADLALLGDIHKMQFLNKEKTVAYAGSLLQQDHSESLTHGFLLWDIEKKSSQFIEIENDWGYVTIEVNNGQIIPPPKMPKNPRIRLKLENTSSADVKKILSVIKQKYNVDEVSLQRINSYTDLQDVNEKILLGDIRDPEYQNELLTKYLQKNFVISDLILDKVRHINRTVNGKLISKDIARNITWKPKKFEWSNMFCYGEGNSVDFSNMHGAYGMFAENSAGKSSFMDCIAYCMFDKSSRSTKGTHVINNKKDTFECKFNFEIKGIDYFIERKGQRKDNGTVKVDVEFYRIINGQIESLNGEERDDTNKMIRSYLGTYDDFVMTTLSLQNDNTGFIDAIQSQRKDILCKFLDIGIFEDLYDIASQEISDTAAILRKLKKEDFSDLLIQTQEQIKIYENELSELKNKKEQHDCELHELTKKYTDLLSKYKSIDDGLIDIDKLNTEKQTIDSDLKYQIKVLSDNNDKLLIATKVLNELREKFPDNIQEINDGVKELELLENEFNRTKQSIDKLNIELKNKQDKLKNLEKHEYDPNCEYCINNVFVKDAIDTKNNIQHDLKSLSHLNTLMSELQQKIETKIIHRDQKINVDLMQEKINKTNQLISSIQSNIQIAIAKRQANDSKMSVIEKKIEDYYSNENAIKSNLELDVQVKKLKKDIDFLNQQLLQLNDGILNTNGDYQVQLKTRETILSKIQELQDLEAYFEAYERYLNAISRNGIPYEIISSALPKIEHEVNNILSQLVDFTIAFDTDGKNINAYIVYDDDNFWLIELTAGMEKFISSLAIRNALISISNLPKPNFIAIDEGLGSLDAHMISQIYLLFSYLKNEYSFIILISHLDSTKDMVDSHLNIQKNGDFSKLIHA